jgi:cytochrome c553
MSHAMKTLSLLSALALAGVSGLARADAAAGHEKAKQVCAACHGEAGDKPIQPEYPVLAGQHPDYLMKALRDYKSGQRKNPVMGGMAQPLTAKEIRDLADWFSSQTGPLRVKR